MTTPILVTKLFTPHTRPEQVPRPHLIERLNAGLHRKLTLISAPAGFGKTTLVSEWVANCERPVAWLSLDEEDNDPTRFLTYVVAALQTIDAKIGAGALSLLQSQQQRPAEWILTSLINEVAETPQKFILFLDDYHVIQIRPIHDALNFLIDRLPPQMHLAIASRANPPLPLSRLRGRGELTGLRASDLRFTPGEAATFLNQMMGLDLSEEDVAALETRTEGWIAGLQMAALSMQGRTDLTSFIQAFTGSHHFIIDYLVEEVLQRQTERVRKFLLQTSILDRLSGPLCDAITGQDDGSQVLETLERGNLFVIPLDEVRQWYRYHHLFADVLLARSKEQQPDQISIRHLRASEWYAHNGLPFDAIRHAIAAEDYERAANLIELIAPEIRRTRQEATLLAWLNELPDEIIRIRPVLNVGYAQALLGSGELEASEARLRDVERWLDAQANLGEQVKTPMGEMVIVDDEQFRSLPGWIAVLRAVTAQARGDVPSLVKYARRALDHSPESDHLLRGAAAALLGLAFWASGDLEAGYRNFAEGMTHLRMAGNIADAISGTLVLADIRRAQGRLHQAMSTHEQALRLAMEQGEPVIRGTADLYVGMSELYCERGELEIATQHLLKSKELGERAGLPENQNRWFIAMARIKRAQGDLDIALDLLQTAEHLYIAGYFPNVRPIAAMKAQIWIAQGSLAEALAWAQERELSVEDDLSYLSEFEHLTLARLLIAQYNHLGREDSIRKAVGLLERLLRAAEEGERMGSVIEILLLQALAQEAQGNISLAITPLERALTLAEPEGYMRIFVDEGPAMAKMLREALKANIAPNYVSQLLATIGEAEDRRPVTQHLIEPLSERELEVLRLLGSELSGPEIARKLMVSLHTIRTHTQNIYRKLGVNKRRAAVRRAKELDLL